MPYYADLRSSYFLEMADLSLCRARDLYASVLLCVVVESVMLWVGLSDPAIGLRAIGLPSFMLAIFGLPLAFFWFQTAIYRYSAVRVTRRV